MSTSLRLAFTVVYFLDSDCTEYHRGGEDNSTYGVAIETAGAYDDSQPNVTIFPAKCTDTDGLYNVYLNTYPNYVADLEVPEDLTLLYYSGEYVQLQTTTDCLLVNGSEYWRPDDAEGVPVTDAFYVKSVVPSPVGSYTGRCYAPTASPVPSPTKRPTTGSPPTHAKTPVTKPTHYTPSTFDGYGLFIAVCVIFGGIGAGMLGVMVYSLYVGTSTPAPRRF